MTCQEINAFLIDYVDGALPEAQRQVFERHIAICPDCAAYLATYRSTIELSRASEDRQKLPPVPEELAAAVIRTLKSEQA